MSKIIENYILQESIGSGQYGKVYRSQNIKTDQTYAIKVVKIGKFKEVPKLHEFTMNEIKTLSKIENPNVIRFVEMLQTCNNVYLVYEFCNGGTLETLVQKRKFLPENEALLVFNQILNAFKSLIKENILHRDLKPSNILLHDGVIKVADFGFCKALLGPQDLTKTMVGSPIYMAPEILKGCNYSIKADIWSMGVVLFEILFGYCPYEDRTIARLINQIDHKVLSIPKHINRISKKTEDLLRKLLVVDPRYRIEWNNLLKINLFEDDIKINNPIINNNIPNSNMPPAHMINNGFMPTNPIEKKLLQKKMSNNSQSSVPTQLPMSNYNSNFTQINNENLMTVPSPTLIPHNNNRNNNVLTIINNSSNEEKSNYFISNLTIEIINQNLKILLRERNKLFFMMNVLTNILENTINEKTAIIGYLLYKNLLNFADILRNSLKEENIEHAIFSKKLERPDLFKETSEFKSFMNLLYKELQQITNCSALFKEELLKTFAENQNSAIKYELENNNPNKKLLFEMSLNYAENIKEKVNELANEGNNEKMRKLLMLGNELLDSLIIDEFFDKFISENQKYSEQKYFEQMKKYSLAELNQIFGNKTEFITEIAKKEGCLVY